MSIKDVKDRPGYVYDDSVIKSNEDGERYYSAYFDKNRAKKLGMDDYEISKRDSGMINETIYVPCS